MSEPTTIERLERLLNQEREALLKGDFNRIESLVEEKQDLVKQLREHDARRETLLPLRAGLRRNQELFDQALAGIRNVAARLGDLSRARKSTQTYDSLGRKKSIQAPEKRKLERKA